MSPFKKLELRIAALEERVVASGTVNDVPVGEAGWYERVSKAEGRSRELEKALRQTQEQLGRCREALDQAIKERDAMRVARDAVLESLEKSQWQESVASSAGAEELVKLRAELETASNMEKLLADSLAKVTRERDRFQQERNDVVEMTKRVHEKDLANLGANLASELAHAKAHATSIQTAYDNEHSLRLVAEKRVKELEKDLGRLANPLSASSSSNRLLDGEVGLSSLMDDVDRLRCKIPNIDRELDSLRTRLCKLRGLLGGGQ